ncbi:ScbR family autoregulator-binding transcription factor [Cryobacterium psychrophilum]|uniref:TetR/AcrR family transcriptional regulator n=1 Tax=Cryobacterium psychrophilum TaxID=41988 RepID=A0A4Y8KPW9_9MICO|nr:ScbR family autoregulator-binding transcription factor [Cryobacterium psychrophilum]TDW29105.1 TetR family transcriptional regulator [Cryobacterium psychrophilum]TFD79686.1 TetR/AcrR family transcriptional regulator [Cryobacterium psychrophilum]
MAQQERAIETRAAIIRGAAAAFQTRGYGSTSLAQVSAAAGVTKGALYFHFDSKEALAVAVIDAQHEASAAIGRTLLSENVLGLRAIIIMSLELARQLHEDPIVSAGVRLTIEAANFETPVAGPYLDWMEACEEYLRRGIAEGEISPDIDTVAMAHFIISAFTGVQVVSDVLTGRDDIEDRLIEMWAVVMPSLVPTDRWLELKDLPTRIREERAAA